jgi:hypothetical protein
VTPVEAFHYNSIYGQPLPRSLSDFQSNKEAHTHRLLYDMKYHTRQVDEGELEL